MKRVQVSLRNNLKNKKYKSAIKTAIKKILSNRNSAIHLNQVEAVSYLSRAYSKIDKSISKGIIKKNKGARQKSKLLREIKKYF